MANRPPAGRPSIAPRKDVVKRNPATSNVERFIKREDQLHAAKSYTKSNEESAIRSQWEEKQNLRSNNGSRTQKTQELESEMDLMNQQLVAIRHERLAKYYQECYDEWDQQLQARGLALIRDRD